MKRCATILGCGSSGGVPRIGWRWGKCDPENPRNRRRRCALLLENIAETDTEAERDASTRVLIDVSPDLREQLLSVSVNHLDGVVLTHEHADHLHGIDDLRPISAAMENLRIDFYASKESSEILRLRFGYCFEKVNGYPPILTLREVNFGDSFSVTGAGGALPIETFRVEHAGLNVLGVACGRLAYMPDVKIIPPEAERFLARETIDTWIIDALRWEPHRTHLSVEEAVAWAGRLGMKRVILTNLHIDLDYETLKKQLPSHIVPAYDGMRIEDF